MLKRSSHKLLWVILLCLGFALVSVLFQFLPFRSTSNAPSPSRPSTTSSSRPSTSYNTPSSAYSTTSSTHSTTSSTYRSTSTTSSTRRASTTSSRPKPQESYTKFVPLKIKTYDGKNQLTHPKVLYFPQRWNGFRYWMAATPYPYAFDDVENPCIYASDNGIDWVTPAGVKNPVIPPPPDVKKGGHYSDTHLVMRDGILELWYRYNPAKTDRTGPDNSISILYRTTTKNAVQWEKPTEIMRARNGLMSPVINWEDERYRIWYSTYDKKLWKTESGDLKTFSTPEEVKLSFPVGGIWHQDIIRTENGYEGLFCSVQPSVINNHDGSAYATAAGRRYALWYATSKDGLQFSKPIEILPSDQAKDWRGYSFYRSSLVRTEVGYKLYIAVIDPANRWTLVYRQLPFKEMPTGIFEEPTTSFSAENSSISPSTTMSSSRESQVTTTVPSSKESQATTTFPSLQ